MLTWDPATIQLELTDLVGGELPPAVFNKIMAAVEIVNSDSFYNTVSEFNRLCAALISGILLVNVWEPITTEEAALAVAEAVLIWPPETEDGTSPFSKEIVVYVGEIMKNEGIVRPPDILKISPALSDMWTSLQVEYSDDPVMMATISNAAESVTAEVDASVVRHLHNIRNGLQNLPLRNGSTAKVTEAIDGLLRGLSQIRANS